MTVKLCSASNRATGVRVTWTGLRAFPACRAVLRVITTVIASNNWGLTMRYSGRGQQTGGRRAWAWARRSVAGIGLPVSPERGERRESSSASPPASACPGHDGGAGLGLSGVFRRLRLPMRRRAVGGRASAAIPGTGGRTGALARSWRCAAAALLVAFAALLSLPLQAQAQTVVTLVNSLNQTEGQSSTALGNNWEVAQGFTTGSNADGYTLTNIRSVFPTILGSTPSLTVTLHKDAPANAAIATLTNPATIEIGQLTFTAPANTTLDASTTYYVLFHGEDIWLESTTSDDEDTNGLSDWSVEDVRYRRDDRTSGAFTEVAVSTPIRVRGTVDVATPTVSISADKTTAVFKEDGITYTLTRTGSTTAALDVSISLSQPDGKDFLLAADLPQTVTIAAGQSTNTFTIAASSFQHFAAGTMVEAGTLTAVVEDEDGPGGDYDLGTPFSVNVAIVIGATVRIELASNSVAEAAGTLSVKVIARTGPGAPQPTSSTSSLTFSSVDDTAVNGMDYNFSGAGEQFFPSEFSMTSGVWQAEDSFDLTITNDEDDEDDESFILKLEYHLGHQNTPLVDASGNSCGSVCTVTVTIVDDDGTPASPRSISIADASAAENAGHLLFDVTLSRSSPNTVKVDFETISGGTATEGVDYYARRTYTHVILAGDKTAQMGFALIEDTVAAAGETVKVRLSNARVVDAYGDKIKDLDITTDEATGTITAPPTTTTTVPNLTIGIRDATGDEDDGWLDFRVRLSRKYTDLVCYDFETISGGTAEEGRDYLKFPKAMYWMQIGKQVDKPFVRIIDDSVSDSGETVKVKISNARLCDDASKTVTINRAEATGTITNHDPLPRAGLPPLTASFSSVPGEHDGSSAFTFRIAFSADLNISYVTLRDQALTVSGGTAKKARRVDGRKDLWELTVKPSGSGAVTVRLPAGSLETPDGRGLERSVSATIAGPVGITVDDAEVREAPGAVLAFTVSLSRAASGSVRVNYATSDGTATAGSDYTARSGTLTFTAGETSKTVSVPVLDDAHDDGGETLTLTLSNASGARIDDARATGTINNDDPLQRAWLARFGRTAAEHVLDGVQTRLSAPRNAGMEVSLAGQSIRGRAFETAPEQYAAMHAHDGAAAWDGLESFSHWMANGIDEAGIGGSMAGRMNARNDAADSGSAMAGRMSGRNLMMGSAFALTADMEGGSSVAVWGRGAYSGFSGQAHDVALEGEVATAMLGTDYAAGGWIAGLSLSFSEGDGTYRLDGREGALNSSMTGLYPYVGYEITDRLSAWGVAGYGRGDMTLTLLDSTEAIRTDIGLTMGAMGARGELVPRTAAAGFGLAVTSDVLVVSTTSDAATGMAAADADVSRLRLGLDGSWLFQFDGGTSITPSFEIGMRNDGGDAETGFGVDIGGGLAFANAQSGFGFELNARGLLAHEDSDFREWGVSGAFRFDPNPSSELGLSLSVGPSWGASPTGGVNALLGRETMTGVALDGATPQGGRLGTEAAWGFPAFGGRYTGTPYLGLGLTEAGRDYRFGWRLGAVDIEALELALGLEGTRRESGGRPPVHGAMLLSSLRW